MVSDMAVFLVVLPLLLHIQVLHVLSDQHGGVEEISQKPEVLA